MNTGKCTSWSYRQYRKRSVLREREPHVNLVSRLEGLAQNDQIIISSYTLVKIEDKFEVETVRITWHEKIKSFENISEYHKVLR